jgi:hypothetical protein
MELGKEREVIHYVGMAECHVLGCNLTRNEFKEKAGYDLGYDPVYTRSPKVGDCKAINLVMYLKEVTTGHIFQLAFFLEDRQSLTANNNLRYVNAKCQSTVVLKDWFTKYQHRVAFHGEPDLLTFIRVFTSPELKWYGDYPTSGNYPLDETQTIFQENFAPLNDIIRRYNKWTIGVLTGIRTSEKGEFQDVYNRGFVKGSSVKLFHEMKKGIDPSALEKDVREFITTAEGSYGYKNYFGDDYQFRRYQYSENIIANTNSAIIVPNEMPDGDLPF